MERKTRKQRPEQWLSGVLPESAPLSDEDRRGLENKLYELQRMDSLGTLAAGIAHDFRNLLCVITGYAGRLDAHLDSESDLRSDVEQILRAARLGSSLVDRICAFTRHVEVERVPTDVSRLVGEAVALVRALLPCRFEIDADVPERVATVLADSSLISQVILNLATNAAHAMEPRGGVLTIAVETQCLGAEDVRTLGPPLRAGPHAVLSVRDAGHGIDAETMSRIFDPFFTTKAPGQGTGLGLAVANGIVNGHDGVIGVESEPGVGTTFRIYLPLVRAEEHLSRGDPPRDSRNRRSLTPRV